MSVVFSPSTDSNVPHIIACFCGQVESPVFASFELAYEEFKKGAFVCNDIYCGYPHVQPSVEEPELQVSNINASYLLDSLNISPELSFEDKCCGSLPVDEFSTLVETALASLPYDEGVADLQVGRTFFGGREAGYVQVKLINLRNIVAWARDNNRPFISWG